MEIQKGMIYLLSLLGIFKKSENCDLSYRNRETIELKRDGGQTQQNKGGRKKESEREEKVFECWVFWFHPPIVSSRRRKAMCCGAQLMNGAVCTGLLHPSVAS